MSQNFNEFNYMSNDDFFEMDSPQNDESIESENDFAINILSDKLFYNINKMSKSNNKTNSFISYKSGVSSSSKKDKSIGDTEQINEVKYKFFMIMKNKCSYNDEYNKIFLLSGKKYEIKLRRLVIQKMSIDSKNEIIYGKKDYIFFPINSNEVEFNYEIGANREFIMSINKRDTTLKCDGIELKSEEQFKEEYPEIKKVLEKEKEEKEKKEKEKDEKRNYPKKKNKDKKENKLEENNNDEKQKISDNNKKEDDKNKNNEQNEKEKSPKDENSEDEVNQKYKYYLNQESNNFYRFVYCNCYEKEVDDIYTINSKINLNISGEVEFYKEMMAKIGQNYNTNNDLKAHIIYKNFESDVIEENTPMLLEVKASFDFYRLLLQIKQNVKLINHLKLESKIKLPEVIIGIMCNCDFEKEKFYYERLFQNYENKSVSIIKHNTDIINEEINGKKIKVVIGVIKDGKIGKYPLNIEDYSIKDPEIKKSDVRVDLNLLNKLALDNSYSDKDIKEIKDKYFNKYESLSYEEKIFTLSQKEFSLLSSSSEESKKLKEKLKKIEEENKEKEEKMKEMIEKKEEEMKKKEEEMKKMKEEMTKKEEEMKKTIENKEEEMKKTIENKEEEMTKMKEIMKEMIKSSNPNFSNEDVENYLKQKFEEKK